jgi:Fuc2NAc and GlcNAc transferase
LIILSAFLVVLFSATVTWCFMRALIPILSLRMLDRPNERSSHTHVTPRGGGLAIVLVSCVTSGSALFYSSGFSSTSIPLLTVPLLVLPLALVGFLDDRYNLPASWRYVVQLATAIVLTLASPLVISSPKLVPFLALMFLLIIAVTAVINFINFMDGLDGLVAGCMSVAITAVAIKLEAPWPTWSLVGALLGFLFWNWSPAKVFMGDVGSTFLGAVFASLVLQASTWSEALATLLVVIPLLGDTCLCFSRRLLAGQCVFQPHRLHLFQRLHQAGWTHPSVSTLYILSTVVLAIALLWGGLLWVITLASIEMLIGIWLDQRVAVSFAEASST